VREVDGLWVGIWHPNLTAALGFPGALHAYEDLVAALLNRDPWMPTLSEAVAWRRARRSVRAVGLDASGDVRLAATDDGTAPHAPHALHALHALHVTLEDAGGRPIASHVDR
jgi:hypothetical protein